MLASSSAKSSPRLDTPATVPPASLRADRAVTACRDNSRQARGRFERGLVLAGEGFALAVRNRRSSSAPRRGRRRPIHRTDVVQQLLEGIRKLEAIGDRLEIGDDLVGDLGQSTHFRPPFGRVTTAGMTLLRSLKGSVAFVGSRLTSKVDSVGTRKGGLPSSAVLLNQRTVWNAVSLPSNVSSQICSRRPFLDRRRPFRRSGGSCPQSAGRVPLYC